MTPSTPDLNKLLAEATVGRRPRRLHPPLTNPATKGNPMKYLLFTTMLLACQPAIAGGPVLVTEDAEVTTEPQRKIGALPWIIGGLLVAAIIAGGGSNCTVEEPTPEPEGRC